MHVPKAIICCCIIVISSWAQAQVVSLYPETNRSLPLRAAGVDIHNLARFSYCSESDLGGHTDLQVILQSEVPVADIIESLEVWDNESEYAPVNQQQNFSKRNEYYFDTNLKQSTDFYGNSVCNTITVRARLASYSEDLYPEGSSLMMKVYLDSNAHTVDQVGDLKLLYWSELLFKKRE